MDKENKSAAGLRRSAMAERIRLREEWSALKETEEGQGPPRKPRKIHQNVLRNKDNNILGTNTCSNPVGEVLRGVVALVEVGGGGRALALRAALAALGASVAARWSPLVTHLVWAEGGCRATRARARALAARLVSPLWVEASAAGARRLPEAAFPAAARPSDLPSPRTLQALLKRADAEGVPITALFPPAPRRSRAAAVNTSSSTDATTDVSTVPSVQKRPRRVKANLPTPLPVLLEESKEMVITPQGPLQEESVSFVNTLPRGGGGGATKPPPRAAAAPRSRRKLFTQRDVISGSEEPSDEECVSRVEREDCGGKRALARAERLARRLARTNKGPRICPNAPRIVLSGMSRVERQEMCAIVRALGGRVQVQVTRRTTHVLLGACTEQTTQPDVSGLSSMRPAHPEDMTTSRPAPTHRDVSGVSTLLQTGDDGLTAAETNNNHHQGTGVKVRTLNALLGAARGCYVLHAEWAHASHRAGRWLHHTAYEVKHLTNISQKARAERKALGLMRAEYAYDVFCGMRVRVADTSPQRAPALQLLALCGAVLVDSSADITIGSAHVAPKWVFDSVAAGRMRTARRYLNHEHAAMAQTLINC